MSEVSSKEQYMVDDNVHLNEYGAAAKKLNSHMSYDHGLWNEVCFNNSCMSTATSDCGRPLNGQAAAAKELQ